MRRSRSKFYSESWINSIKQIIEPGDECVAITSSKYGPAIRVVTGKFLGVNKDDAGTVTSVKLHLDKKRKRPYYTLTATGERISNRQRWSDYRKYSAITERHDEEVENIRSFVSQNVFHLA